MLYCLICSFCLAWSICLTCCIYVRFLIYFWPVEYAKSDNFFDLLNVYCILYNVQCICILAVYAVFPFLLNLLILLSNVSATYDLRWLYTTWPALWSAVYCIPDSLPIPQLHELLYLSNLLNIIDLQWIVTLLLFMTCCKCLTCCLCTPALKSDLLYAFDLLSMTCCIITCLTCCIWWWTWLLCRVWACPLPHIGHCRELEFDSHNQIQF